VQQLEAASGCTFQPCGAGDLRSSFGPEDIVHYVYAVLHSHGYRSRYNALLKTGFPRIPLPAGGLQFRNLTLAGQRLASLHLMQTPLETRTHFRGDGPAMVARGFPRFEAERVAINPLQYFAPVPIEVWQHFTGGYQVCRKWLQDRAPRGGKRPRKPRQLSPADIHRYQQVVAAIAASLQVVDQINTTP